MSKNVISPFCGVGERHILVPVAVCCLYPAIFLLFAANAEAQQVLSKTQKATIRQLVEELRHKKGDAPTLEEYSGSGNVSDADLKNIINDIETITDPILVGRNVVFDKKFLQYGVTREQFARTVRTVDRAYDLINELVGTKPLSGEIIYVYCNLLHSKTSTWTAVGGMGRTNRTSIVGINGHKHDYVKTLLSSDDGGVIPHEMAHSFIYKQPYHFVNHSLICGIIDPYVWEALGQKAKAQGAHYRLLKRAHDNNRKGVISTNYNLHSQAGAVSDIYVIEMFGKVGYEPFKKALHSYHDESYPPQYTYTTLPRPAAGYNGSGPGTDKQIVEFLDRVVYFSGKPNILNTLSDNGELLKKFLVIREAIKEDSRGGR